MRLDRKPDRPVLGLGQLPGLPGPLWAVSVNQGSVSQPRKPGTGGEVAGYPLAGANTIDGIIGGSRVPTTASP